MSQGLFEYVEDAFIECQHCGSPVFFEEVSIHEDVDTGELFIDCPECGIDNDIYEDEILLPEDVLTEDLLEGIMDEGLKDRIAFIKGAYGTYKRNIGGIKRGKSRKQQLVARDIEKHGYDRKTQKKAHQFIDLVTGQQKGIAKRVLLQKLMHGKDWRDKVRKRQRRNLNYSHFHINTKDGRTLEVMHPMRAMKAKYPLSRIDYNLHK